MSKRPSIERLRENFASDDNIAFTVTLNDADYVGYGGLIWKQDRGTAKRGAVAGTVTASKYSITKLDEMPFPTSHGVYAIHHGVWPKQLDHINGDKLDNRIGNLRPSTSAQNRWNTGISRANKSGIVGVFQRKDHDDWSWSCVTHGVRAEKHGYLTKEHAEQARHQHVLETRGEFAIPGQQTINTILKMKTTRKSAASWTPSDIKNTTSTKKNTTTTKNVPGYPGIYRIGDRFVVRKSLGGIKHYLGIHPTLQAAVDVLDNFVQKWEQKWKQSK